MHLLKEHDAGYIATTRHRGAYPREPAVGAYKVSAESNGSGVELRRSF
jgi:hypothetical protein